MKIDVYGGLRDLPHYDQDLDTAEPPPSVADLRARIRAADGLLIATPEYNYGVPGVLKNAIDWASRPPSKSVLNGKPAALMGATPGGTGTARAQLALRQSFVFTDTRTLLRPEILVARAHEKVDAHGRVTDATTRQMIRQLLDALADWAPRVAARPTA